MTALRTIVRSSHLSVNMQGVDCIVIVLLTNCNTTSWSKQGRALLASMKIVYFGLVQKGTH